MVNPNDAWKFHDLNDELSTSPISGPNTISAILHRIEAVRILSSALVEELSAFRFDGLPNLPEAIDLTEELKRYEVDLIQSALIRCRGRQVDAAKLLKMNPTTLNEKIRRLGIKPREFIKASKMAVKNTQGSVRLDTSELMEASS